MQTPKPAMLAIAFGAILGPAPATAQFGMAARASTLGLGAEISYRPRSTIGLRVGGNLLGFSRNESIDNNDYRISLHLESATAIIDVYPVGGAFHLSGGLLLNNNRGRLAARLNQSLDIGNQSYTPQEVRSLTGMVDFKTVAPYAGLGFGGRGRVAFLFDLGVAFTGTPRVDLTGETTLTGAAKAEFDANVARELNDVRAEVDKQSYFKFHPVLSLGLRFRL